MKRLQWTLVMCIAAALCIGNPMAYGQVLYGSIVGTVEDQSGAIVPGAVVSISDRTTGQTRETRTTETGRFSFVNVLAGAYDLKVAAQGFRSFTQSNVVAVINTVTRTDVKLDVGAATEQITVAASAAMLQTEKADVHSEINTREVRDLPLVGYRNYQSLMNLVPGATPTAEQNSAHGAPARSLTTNINGTNRNNNVTRLDGAVNVFIWLPHHTAYVPPAESIEDVSIATNNFDAEQGMAGGAAITVVTRSGTNELHGSVYGYHTNNHMKAKNFFYAKDKLPMSNRNMDGFTLGGPIRKNKLFFFGDFEAMRERSEYSATYTLATADQRAGNFSAYGTTIYDPTTGTADGKGREPFANATIPLSRQSAITRKLQDLVPATNLSGTTSNYFKSGNWRFDRENYDLKVNWNPNTSQTFFVKYSAMNANPDCDFALGGAGGGALCSSGVPGKAHTITQVATIGSTWTVTPRLILDGTVGWTRLTQQATNHDYGANFGLDTLGIPGTNGPDPRQSGMPGFTFTTYSSLGDTDNPRPNFYADQSYTTSINASTTRSKHEIRFGFDMIRHQLNHWQPELANPRGAFSFGGGVTALNGGASPNQYNSYAAFLLGLPNSMTKSLQYLTMSGREWQLGSYFRDRWSITPRFTLTLGVRYEFYPLMTRASRGLERYDPGTNQVLLGRLGGNPDNVGITVSKKLFAPRVGFAYRLNDATVIRSGYGITYDPLPISRPLRGPYPATISADFSGNLSYNYYQPIEQGIPYFNGPDMSTGTITLPTTFANRSVWAGQLDRGYIQSWNLIVERKLPGEFVTTVGYVGTQTVHQFSDLDINASTPGKGNNGRPLAAKFGRTVSTTMFDGWMNANYHALQATLLRRVKSFFIKGAYTFSKSINMTDEDGWASVSWNEPSVIARNRALAGYDRTHMLQMAWSWDLPLGPGQKLAQSGFGSRLLRDWQINGLFSSYTGSPFGVSASDASLAAPGNSQTADQVKSTVAKLGDIGSTTPFFDPLAFRAVTDVRYGTTGRNILRGPGVVNANLSVFRGFRLTERFNLQFRGEAFNLTNTPHFNNPSTNASNMKVTPDGTLTSLGGFLAITGAQADERNFRVGLRLSF